MIPPELVPEVCTHERTQSIITLSHWPHDGGQDSEGKWREWRDVHLTTCVISFGWSPYEGTYLTTRILAASVACKMSICKRKSHKSANALMVRDSGHGGNVVDPTSACKMPAARKSRDPMRRTERGRGMREERASLLGDPSNKQKIASIQACNPSSSAQQAGPHVFRRHGRMCYYPIELPAVQGSTAGIARRSWPSHNVSAPRTPTPRGHRSPCNTGSQIFLARARRGRAEKEGWKSRQSIRPLHGAHARVRLASAGTREKRGDERVPYRTGTRARASRTRREKRRK